MADKITDAELEQKVNEVYKFNIDGQAKFFLKQFVMDFFGKFEEVISSKINQKNSSWPTYPNLFYKQNLFGFFFFWIQIF